MVHDNLNTPTLKRRRIPLLALALLALVAATWAGLVRIGWGWPALRPTLPMMHGPLMVSGFLGALISLERAIALVPIVKGRDRWLVYLPALLAGVGGALVAGGWLHPLGPALMAVGSLGLVLLMTLIYRLHPAFYSAVILWGAALWFVGNSLWLLGQPVFRITLWWAGFLVLTIAGERLELSRLLNLSTRSLRFFYLAMALTAGGLLLSLFNYGVGMRLMGLGLVVIALWLLRYDIARRRLRAGGQPQFIASALILGYFWLAISGLLFIRFGGMAAGPYYDAMLHTVFLGFVFSMIFAHATIVFPAVLGTGMPFSNRFYSHLGLLHLSLLVRILGDLALGPVVRQWGGLLNALALLLFLVNTALAIRRGR